MSLFIDATLHNLIKSVSVLYTPRVNHDLIVLDAWLASFIYFSEHLFPKTQFCTDFFHQLNLLATVNPDNSLPTLTLHVVGGA